MTLGLIFNIWMMSLVKGISDYEENLYNKVEYIMALKVMHEYRSPPYIE